MGLQWLSYANTPMQTPMASPAMGGNPEPPMAIAPLQPEPSRTSSLDPQGPKLLASFQSERGSPVYVFALGNGHRVIIEPRNATDVISLRTFINAGSIDESPIHPSLLYPSSTPAPSGLAHLDEHCHFLDTQQYPKKNSWTARVEEFGTDFNATTDNEYIQHEMTFNHEALPTMLAMHADSVLHPKYNPKDIQQEKTNVINEMAKREAPPDAKVYNKLYELMFERPGFQTLGRKSDVQKATVEDLKRFHQTYYTPTNMVTVISGPVDIPQVLNMMTQAFGQNPAKIQPNLNAGLRLALRPGEIRQGEIHDPQLNHTIATMAFPAPSKSNLRERIAMEVLWSILGDSPSGQLYKALQPSGSMPLANDISTYYEPLKQAGTFQISFSPTQGQERNVIQTIQGLLSPMNLWSTVNNPTLVNQIKNKLHYQFINSLANTENATMALGSEAFTNSLGYYSQYSKILETLSPQELYEVAQKYLNPNTFAVVWGMPGPADPIPDLESTQPTGQPMFQGNKPSKKAVRFGQAIPLSQIGALALNQTQVTQSSSVFHYLGQPQHGQLCNGVTASFLQVPGQTQSCLTIALPLSAPYSGLRELLPDILCEGTPAIKTLTDQWRNQGISFDPEITGDRLILKVVGPANQESQMMQAARTILTEPFRMSPSDFSQIQRNLLSRIQNGLTDPEVKLSDAVLKSAYGENHPYAKSTMAILSDLSRQTPNNVLAVYQQALQSLGQIQVMMVSPQAPVVLKNLLDWNIQQMGWQGNPYRPVSMIETPPVQRLQGTQKPILVPNDSVDQAYLTVGWRAPSIQSPDYPAFCILRELLEGSAGKFFKELRTKQGLVYGTSEHYASDQMAGNLYTVSAQVAYDNIDRGLKAIDKVRDDMRNKSISQKALDMAKSKYRLRLRELVETPDGIASGYDRWLETGQSPQSLSGLQSQIEAVTAADVRRVAQELFSPESRYQVAGISAPQDVLATYPSNHS